MKPNVLVAVALTAALGFGTWVLLQLTTDIGVLTWLGIIGGGVGLIVGAIAFMKLPALRAGMIAGALLGGGAAAYISYQTFFAINDEAFVETKAQTDSSQKALDAAFGDEGSDDDF